MVYKTLSQLRSKIEKDLDLQDELFITAAEINDYINEAIDDVEAQIHTLYEDYFLKYGGINLSANIQTYSLPSDIYANKIRALLYENGAKRYEVKRMKNLTGFLEQSLIDYQPNSTEPYRYRLINDDAATGCEIRLFPTPQETGAYLTIWYIRNANTLSQDSDECDIPEFYTYIIQYAKCRCYEKEPGHPNYAAALQERERLRGLMIETLQNMVPDSDNGIEMDYSFYDDLS